MRGLLFFAVALSFGAGLANATSLVEALEGFDADDWIKGLRDTEECRSVGQELATTVKTTRPATLELLRFEEAHHIASLMRDEPGKREFNRLYVQAEPGATAFGDVDSRLSPCIAPPKTKADIVWQTKMGIVEGCYANAISAYRSSRAILKLP